jgi:hypothetical protein
MTKMYLGDVEITSGSPVINITSCAKKYNSVEYKEIGGKKYRLIFDENFDSPFLDKNVWTDNYLISRVNPRYLTYGKHKVNGGKLSLIVEPNSTVKSGIGDLSEATNPLAVSGIQSIEKNALHLISPVNHDVNPYYGFICQDGYWEIRCKCPIGDGVHSSFWLVGIQDKTAQRYEVDIVEYKGNTPMLFPHGSHNNGNEADVTENYPSNYTQMSHNLSDDYHTIGWLWESDGMTWFLDGVQLDYLPATMPQYPMGIILALYQRKYGDGWTGPADDTLGTLSFDIDYVKVYKPSEYELGAVSCTGQDPISISVGDTYSIDNDFGTLTDMPSYCRMNWNDGSKTEHHVKWEIINNDTKSKLDNRVPFVWYGYVDDLGMTVSATITFE